MIEVRRATLDDISGVAALIRLHYDSTGFPQEVPYDETTVIVALGDLLFEPTGLLLVAVEGEQAVGTLGMQIATTFFSTDFGARELFLYIKPEFRGQHAGVAMFKLAEEWARQSGCKTIIIGNHPLSPPHVAETYIRHGYREAQTDFIRRL